MAWKKINTQDDSQAHVDAADPHPVYELEANKGVASGYAGLDSSVYVPLANTRYPFVVSSSNPGLTRPGAWIELRGDGTVKTVWVENGL